MESFLSDTTMRNINECVQVVQRMSPQQKEYVFNRVRPVLKHPKDIMELMAIFSMAQGMQGRTNNDSVQESTINQ